MALTCHSSIGALPRASDPDAAARGLDDWRREAGAALAGLADSETGRAVLYALFGNAPFLGQCALRYPATLADVLRRGPGPVFDELLPALETDATAAGADEAALMRTLRLTRRQVALVVGLADIAGAWDGPAVTAALSRFAEAAVGHAVDHLLAKAAREGVLLVPVPERPGAGSGLVVLAMGKLGGGELNFSSDIDLIVLYDADRAPYRGRSDIQEFFVRMTRGLARILEQHTGDGFVFRTDLRLRPDPSATPPALSVEAAEGYYASLGQNWERAAMIKARPVAGDRDGGEAFLLAIRPFVWRKHLDFAAIQDIHSIKRQIHAHRGGGKVAVLGHNVKLGRGGIRDIEFFTQTQQLIWGGRYQSLRRRRTVEALRALREIERITAEEEADLAESYWYLRRIEHRLQMVMDQQTHTLPKDREGLARLAVFLGHRCADAFEAEITRHLERVAGHCGPLFEDAPALGAPTPEGGNLVFTSADDDPETLETLTQMGFRNATAVSRAIRAWHHGRLPATRSTRARELLTELTPTLLAALARTANPDQAFTRFDEFLSNLPAGVQLFSLFQAAPKLLDLVAEIVGGAPRIADYLSRHASLFDAVLARGFYDDLPAKPVLKATLAHELELANDLEDRLEIARKWAADAKFQVSVHQLLGLRDGPSARRALTDIADALIEAMLGAVEVEFAKRHGRIDGGALAVLGFGKLGSRQLSRGSDLDLVFVYRSPGPRAQSDGERPLSPPVYYARLCQRLITALTIHTGAGLLYAVDMRLRPMGNDGPLAAEISGFERYYREDAWTWELMALTRARVVVGPPDLANRIEAVIRDALMRPRDPYRLAADVLDMRLRIAREHGTDDIFAIKHVRGGLVDVEFVVQYLLLRDAAEHPQVLCTGTIEALEALAAAGRIEPARAEELIEAARLFHDVQAMRRLALSGPFDVGTAPEGVWRALSRAGGAVDFATLKARLLAAQARVRRHFADLVETPAAAQGERVEKRDSEA
jgi:glutamate-ammonia-ligase adenylyltransferase